MSCRATLAVRRAFLHSVAQCTIVTAFFAFMCSMHKKLLKNDGYFMQFFVRSMNFFLPPQYIVLEPAKMRYFQLKITISCGFTQFAFRSKWCYAVLAQSKTATQHQPAVRRVYPPAPLVCTLPSKRRPVKDAHPHSAHSAADSEWKLQAGTAQRTYHSKYS